MFSITYIVEAKEGNLAWHIWSLIARSNRHLPNWNDPVIITQTPFTHSAPSTQIQTVPIFVHSYRHWNTHQKSFAARSLSKIIVSETITKSHSLLDPCPKLSSLKHPPSHLLLDPCPKLSSLKHPPKVICCSILVQNYRHWNTHQKSFAARSLRSIAKWSSTALSASLLACLCLPSLIALCASFRCTFAYTYKWAARVMTVQTEPGTSSGYTPLSWLFSTWLWSLSALTLCNDTYTLQMSRPVSQTKTSIFTHYYSLLKHSQVKCMISVGLFGMFHNLFGMFHILFGMFHILFGISQILFGMSHILFGMSHILFGMSHILFGIRHVSHPIQWWVPYLNPLSNSITVFCSMVMRFLQHDEFGVFCAAWWCVLQQHGDVFCSMVMRFLQHDDFGVFCAAWWCVLQQHGDVFCSMVMCFAAWWCVFCSMMILVCFVQHGDVFFAAWWFWCVLCSMVMCFATTWCFATWWCVLCNLVSTATHFLRRQHHRVLQHTFARWAPWWLFARS